MWESTCYLDIGVMFHPGHFRIHNKVKKTLAKKKKKIKEKGEQGMQVASSSLGYWKLKLDHAMVSEFVRYKV